MKAPHQLESHALALLDTLKSGRALARGDGLDACFSVWPRPPRQAARLLAAYANAARGRDVLWLVGVGLGAAGKLSLPGTIFAEFDTWLSSLFPFFDGLVPNVRAFTIPIDSTVKGSPRQIIALQIETARAPFVVRTSAKTAIYEVPWWGREAQQIRSASRTDLIRLLSPLQDLPQFEVLEAELTFYKNFHATGESKITHRWTLDGSLYVIPNHGTQLVIPLHRCRAGLSIDDAEFSSPANDLTLTADKQSPAVRITESAALIEGLGRVFVYCSGATTANEIPWELPLTLTFDLLPAGAAQAAIVSAQLHSAKVTENNQSGRWKL